MSAEQHPSYAAWRGALDHMVEAERRYYFAVMEERSNEEIEAAARNLDEARTKYRTVADKIG